MSMLICRTCGTRMDIPAHVPGGNCGVCGAKYVFSKYFTDNEAAVYNQGTNLRRNGKFDRAGKAFCGILQQNPRDVEALWGRLLCRYGVVYQPDQRTRRYIPVCRYPVPGRIMEDPDYQMLMTCCGDAREQFRLEALRIDAAQQAMGGGACAPAARPTAPMPPVAPRIPAAPVAPAPSTPPEISEPKPPVEKAKKKKAVWISAILAAAAVLAIGLGAYFYLNRPEKEDAALESALASIEAGNYEEALARLDQVQDREKARELEQKCHYHLAEAALEAGDCALADQEFLAADSYEDAEGRVGEGYFRQGQELMKAGQYTQAIDSFQLAETYADPSQEISQCYTALAQQAEAAENLKSAYDNYCLAGNQSRASELLEDDPTLANPGDTIVFGTYEQNGEKKDGTEPLEWYVLANNGGKMLLLSKYALAGGPVQRKNTDVTWETSQIRKTLNKDFYKNAFTKAEKKKILETNVEMERNPTYQTGGGNDTVDYVFLLSRREVERYMVNVVPLNCMTTTAGAADIWTSDSNSCCKWWLRTPGATGRKMMVVDSFGEIDLEGSDVDNRQAGIRPAIWVDLTESTN